VELPGISPSFFIAFCALAGAAFMVGCLSAFLREISRPGFWSAVSPNREKRKNYWLTGIFRGDKREIESHHGLNRQPLYRESRGLMHPRLVTLDIRSVPGLDCQRVQPRYRVDHERGRA
jgi:hypothetical protein